jgi:hypothetical protein
MWLYTDPVKSFQRTPTDAEHETYKAAPIKRVDPSVGANEVSKHSGGLGLWRRRHTRQIGYGQHTYAIPRAESLPVAISSVPSSHSHIECG